MKKLCLLFCMTMVTVLANAGGVKVKEGKATFLKENVVAIVEFDFSKTTWEEKEDFKTWCGDQYEKRKEVMQDAFITSFNENSKGLKVSNNSNEAKYKIIIEVKDLERHQSFTGMWGQGKISTTAYIRIYDLSSNQQICVIFVDGYGSGKDFDYNDGMAKCYKGLAKEITKVK